LPKKGIEERRGGIRWHWLEPTGCIPLHSQLKSKGPKSRKRGLPKGRILFGGSWKMHMAPRHWRLVSYARHLRYTH